MFSKLLPERYNPTAQIKRMAICFNVFVFIIGGNYKLLTITDISKLQEKEVKDAKKKSAVVFELLWKINVFINGISVLVHGSFFCVFYCIFSKTS